MLSRIAENPNCGVLRYPSELITFLLTTEASATYTGSRTFDLSMEASNVNFCATRSSTKPLRLVLTLQIACSIWWIVVFILCSVLLLCTTRWILSLLYGWNFKALRGSRLEWSTESSSWDLDSRIFCDIFCLSQIRLYTVCHATCMQLQILCEDRNTCYNYYFCQQFRRYIYKSRE